MAEILVQDMEAADEYYVGTCTHVNESEEADVCGRRRVAWLRSMHDKGVRAKVALHNGQRVGFLYVMPIEVSPWGPLGRDLMVIPCLYVQEKGKDKGIGRALLEAAEEEARSQGKKGLVTIAYYHDFWFMPATFFERVGFSRVRSRTVPAEGPNAFLGKEAILWKVSDPLAQPPEFLVAEYAFEPAPGKVVVDLFWNTFCQTSNIEAQRVREVAAEFVDLVVLREYPSDEQAILLRYQIPRAILVNGREIGWGYEAPKEGIREAISAALRIP